MEALKRLFGCCRPMTYVPLPSRSEVAQSDAKVQRASGILVALGALLVRFLKCFSACLPTRREVSLWQLRDGKFQQQILNVCGKLNKKEKLSLELKLLNYSLNGAQVFARLLQNQEGRGFYFCFVSLGSKPPCTINVDHDGNLRVAGYRNRREEDRREEEMLEDIRPEDPKNSQQGSVQYRAIEYMQALSRKFK